MTWPTVFQPEISSRLCLTLLHSLWQVALMAIVAGTLARFWRRLPVEWNYIVHVVALLLALIAMPITFWLLSGETQAITVASSSSPTPSHPAAGDSRIPEILPATGNSGESTHGLREIIEVGSPPRFDLEIISARSEPWRRMAPWLVGLYAIGVAAMFLRLTVAMVSAERLRRLSLPLRDGPAATAIHKIAQKWNRTKAPLLAQAERIIVPMVVGVVKPTILLPASALSGLASYELELILAHEFAHVRRHDMWVNLLQRLAEVALFFNPALWYLNRRIAALREYCCDELACGARIGEKAKAKVDYASALLRVVELARPAAGSWNELAALAVKGHSPSELRRRIARLFGEPVSEPLGASRLGMIASAVTVLVIFAGPAWFHATAKTPEQPSAAPAHSYPAPASEADRIVAEARARTFGLQRVPRISLRQTYWNSTVKSMQKAPEQSLKMLWQARGQDVDELMRRNTDTAATVAWDGGKLLIQTDSSISNDAAAPPKLYTQSRYWGGAEGWLGETSPPTRNVYRYAALDKLTDHMMASIYFPQWNAAGGKLTWSGPTVVLEEHNVDPGLTRYQLTRQEVIDGVECDVYEGPARHERLWIEKSSGLIKAACQQYVNDELPNYYSELIRDVANRTFTDAKEYRQWIKDQQPDVQAKLAAHWAASHWKLSKPGNLSIFSDYRKIAPGVRWPMRCERIVVHPAGRGDSNQYRYIRAEIAVTDVKQEFDISELAKAALPNEGDAVTDRRFDPEVTYPWKASLRESDVQAARRKKADERQKAEDEKRAINETPINSVADAIHILTERPAVEPAMVWARAIKYLAEHKEEALPAVIKQLDLEKRDHPISKLAFTLRAIGDRRAVPALIRALPRTLLPSRSDFGLIVDDPDLSRFMQQHDQRGKVRDGGDYFDYGRAFREVASALHRLTDQQFDEMELNWVHLDSPSQRALQQAQFQRVAQRWASWWEANWKSMVDDPAYAKVNLPELRPPVPPNAGRQRPPSGPNLKLTDVNQGWIVQPVQESKQRCFVDLDTMRQAGWPDSLPPIEKIGVDSRELQAWARKEGFDVMGVTYTPPGETEPLYCLRPIDMNVWKITAEEHKKLPEAMSGKTDYPLSQPVETMIPQRSIEPPYDHEYGGDSFLFVTREGTAGVIRMTAQVTETGLSLGGAYSRDDQFSQVGFYRGAKVNFAVIDESEAPPKTSSGDSSKAKQKTTKVSGDQQLKIIVVDAKGKPLVGAKVFQNHVYVPTVPPPDGRSKQIKN